QIIEPEEKLKPMKLVIIQAIAKLFFTYNFAAINLLKNIVKIQISQKNVFIYNKSNEFRFSQTRLN
ncbi:MAG: hypothetical protein AAFW70_19825, partial [Cyanobacteria bacterium J06635_10]